MIAAVLRSWWATAAFITLMVAVAAITSARRVSTLRRGWIVALPIAGGALPIGAAVVAAGTIPWQTVAVLPIAGILIGGAITATSLAGRRALDELRDRHGEYEAALALGFLPRDAALEVCRPSAATALVPALDQTRTVGLVTLPGAWLMGPRGTAFAYLSPGVRDALRPIAAGWYAAADVSGSEPASAR